METIKDIVAEMRKDMPRVVDAKVILRNYADRIEKAVTNFNQLKMREALQRVVDWFNGYGFGDEVVEEMDSMIEYAEASLSTPPRNCDVGTPEEQEARFNKFCFSYYNINNVDCTCGTCPLKENVKGICEFAWMQMPYENEVK
jgi:hypothetical protein